MSIQNSQFGSSYAKDLLWSNPFTVIPLSNRVVGTFSATMIPPTFSVTQTLAGANKIAEYAVFMADNDDPLEIQQGKGVSRRLRHWNDQPQRVGCFVGPYMIKANFTNTMYVGIELGTIDQAPPFNNTPTSAVAQVRWVAGTDTWELYCAKGDGTAGVTTQLLQASQAYDASDISHGCYAELEWNPITRAVTAFINGTPVGSYSGPAFPDYANFSTSSGSHQIMSGLILTSGTSASATVAGFFSGFYHRIIGVFDF